MRWLIVATVWLPLLLWPPQADAALPNATAQFLRPAVIGQASPTPAEPKSATASPSPGAEDDQGGISAAGILIAAILIGGLLLMRTRLLRR